MSIETAIVAALSPLAPTSSFSRASVADRPRITYQRITGRENETLADGSGVKRQQFQIDVWADSYAQARGLADQSKVALRAGLVVGQISDNPDDYEPDTKLSRASFDVAAWI